MLPDPDPRALSLGDVAQHCREESERFFRYILSDTRFCYELFRRAIVERVAYAWTLLYNQYAGLVNHWVERHASFAATGEEATYFVNLAFHKMWSALNAEKFHKFPDLKSLLRYLQLCVQSAIIDYARLQGHHAHAHQVFDAEANHEKQLSVAGFEETVLQGLTDEAFWAHIQQRLTGEKEERVIYFRFILGLKPREICARFPDEFSDVKEVYLLLQNVITRLRRDAELKKFF